jgi:putative toxin-antitoxin system antitoxin component (TIGR02293 family)
MARPKQGRYYEELRGRLGVARLRSDRDLAKLVQERLPTSVIQSLRETGLAEAEVQDLIISSKALAQREAAQQPLTKEESDRAVRVARIMSLTSHVFGEPERGWRWLRKSKRQFDGQTPMQMLGTEAGARVVEELIAQIEHGMGA